MQRIPLNLEFIFKASPTILYKFLTTPNCLIRWFCDEVDVTEDKYTFSWSGQEEIAWVIDDIEDERLRFRWEDADDETEYLEYRLNVSPVTGETILEITDYCDDDEVDEQRQLWDTQMEQLRRATGG
ncbi:MAG: START-like domain-containing protein [Bacteroidota bacterium]